MAWTPTKAEVANVINLDGASRYEYLLKKIADEEQIWGLWRDGWMVADHAGTVCMPVWPHEVYATASVTDEWSGSRPKSIDVETFLSRWIPGLTKDGRMISAFQTDKNVGVIVSPDKFSTDLSRYLDQY